LIFLSYDMALYMGITQIFYKIIYISLHLSVSYITLSAKFLIKGQ